MPISIELLQARARVRETDVGRGRGDVAARAGVAHFELEHVAAPRSSHFHAPGMGRRLDAVPDRILDQRLQHEPRDERVARGRIGLDAGGKPLAEPESFQLEVAPDEIEFL